MNNDAIPKYLDRYAEVEAIVPVRGRHYDYSIVIPAFDESHTQLVEVWKNIKSGTSFLVILIVNSKTADELSARQLVKDLINGQQSIQLAPGAQLIVASNSSFESPDILIIDRFSRGRTIDVRQGVGLARKIGMDIAVSLINQRVTASSWLFTTDADSILPTNYFEVEPADHDAALIFPFEHIAEPGLKLPMQLYEISMLYYVAGLCWANSPYAFPTIGSTISCSANHYATVRGCPKRNTGEDFYLLNKLRKIGNVRLIGGDPIRIAGRPSLRVPIGTGQAIRSIGELNSPETEFKLEHPLCFEKLKNFLRELGTLAAEQPEHIEFADPDFNDYARRIGLIPLYERKQRQSPSAAVMRKHLDDWFDGLKTRQFIHHFRDQHFGRVPATQLESAPFLENETSLDTIAAALRAYIYHPARL